MRVTFDFAGARHVRDLTAVPEVGDWVIHGDELWIVRSIDEADAGKSLSASYRHRSASDPSRYLPPCRR